MIGKLLGLPFRIINAPLKALENLSELAEDLEIASPLDAIAEAFEEIDEDK